MDQNTKNFLICITPMVLFFLGIVGWAIVYSIRQKMQRKKLRQFSLMMANTPQQWEVWNKAWAENEVSWMDRHFPPGCIYEGPLPFGFYMGEPPRNRRR